MPNHRTVRPRPEEYTAFYDGYIRRVPEGDVLVALEQQRDTARERFAALDDESSAHRYAPEKWSIKQVLGHLADTERVMSYRALAFAREDPGALPGMEQEPWAAAGSFDEQPWRDLVASFAAVRDSTLWLVRGLPEEAWSRRGTASGHSITVRALIWIIAGHELYHRELLRERYGVDA
jgi:uncharacterized damage-inducible protein DinB